jgi:hypothetical protein
MACHSLTAKSIPSKSHFISDNFSVPHADVCYRMLTALQACVLPVMLVTDSQASNCHMRQGTEGGGRGGVTFHFSAVTGVET